MKLDLGWGNSVAVREAFLKTYNQKPLIFGPQALLDFNYPAHGGDPELIRLTSDLIWNQLGQRYKHIFITSGATGGCMIAMRAYAQSGYKYCITREAPFYVRYPNMIKGSGLSHIELKDYIKPGSNDIALIDLPSNPSGLMDSLDLGLNKVPVILDGVYLNEVYMDPIKVKTIPHDVLVGSYSKLLGINGIRIGWMATNDDLLAERMSELVTSEYCGLSTASQEILKSVLPDMDWEIFYRYARFKLDLNREKMSQLEKYFGDTPVPDIGMFYYAPMDKKCQELLEKAGVTWTKGSAMGTSDDFGRLNIGQDNRLVEAAVKAILKADRI